MRTEGDALSRKIYRSVVKKCKYSFTLHNFVEEGVFLD